MRQQYAKYCSNADEINEELKQKGTMVEHICWKGSEGYEAPDTRNYLVIFSKPSNKDMDDNSPKETDGVKYAYLSDFNDKDISCLGLPLRYENCLRRGRITTLRALQNVGKNKLSSIRGLGKGGLDEIYERAEKYGLKLEQ